MMKKLLMAIFVSLFIVVSVFPQELIGSRLKYEITGTGNNYCRIRITDVFAGNDNYNLTYYNFKIEKNVSDIYDIYADRGKIGTANLFSDDFPDIIAKYILKTCVEFRHTSEWERLAYTIGNKISQYVKSFHRR
jgi:hypothetical protein